MQAAQAYNHKPYYVGQQAYGTDQSDNLLISFGYYPDFTKVSLLSKPIHKVSCTMHRLSLLRSCEYCVPEFYIAFVRDPLSVMCISHMHRHAWTWCGKMSCAQALMLCANCLHTIVTVAADSLRWKAIVPRTCNDRMTFTRA